MNKHTDEEKYRKEAEDYFKNNFSKLLDDTGTEENNKKEHKESIINKYIEMRRKGFGKPDDNNGPHTNVTRVFGLGRNSLGEKILAERDALLRKKSELKKIKINNEKIHKEANKYFDDNLKSLVVGVFDENSDDFTKEKEAIIKNYISMREEGFYINIDSFFENEHKNTINERIKNLIDKNAEKSVEGRLDKEFEKIKKLYGKEWEAVSLDGEFEKFIKGRMKSGVKIDAYREMRKHNYNANYCRHKISEIGTRSGTDQLEEQIKLYIVLSEKLNKVKEVFKKENGDKGIRGIEYISPFEKMSIEEKFFKLHDVLKQQENQRDKQSFDEACNDLLFWKISFDDCDKKYVSGKEHRVIKATVKLEATWLQKFIQLPGDIKDWSDYTMSWVEWLNIYSEFLSTLRGFVGDKAISFILNKVVYPYLGFWTSFDKNFMLPWRLLLFNNFFKKEDTVFVKALKVVATSISMLAVLGGLVALSVFMPPLIPLTFVAAAWLVPKSGVWSGQGVNALREGYEVTRYGYRDRVRFSVRGELKGLLESKEITEELTKELSGITALSEKIARELEYCKSDTERVKKEIDKNPESKPKNLSWIGGPISYKVQELAKKETEEEEIEVDGEKIKLKKWNLGNLLAKWAVWFLPSDPNAAGKTILSGAELLMGVSPALQKSRDDLRQLKIELDRLEKTKVILNNAWDKIINRVKNESDNDYAKRVIEIEKDMNKYIDDLYLHNHSTKITGKGLNASGIGSFYERFEKKVKYQSGEPAFHKDLGEPHQHGDLRGNSKSVTHHLHHQRSKSLPSISAEEPKFTSTRKMQSKQVITKKKE